MYLYREMTASPKIEKSSSAAFAMTLAEFAIARPAELLQRLADFDQRLRFDSLSHDQRDAWQQQLMLLQSWSHSFLATCPTAADCGIVFEYTLPRSTSRVDVVILGSSKVILLEFKVGKSAGGKADEDQISRYALDIAYYHKESRGLTVVPILFPTESQTSRTVVFGIDVPIESLRVTARNDFAAALSDELTVDLRSGRPPLDVSRWTNSVFAPIPGIIEATIQLFSKQNSRDIETTLAARSDIARVVDHIRDLINIAFNENKKILCLVSGVPGSGKTLVGLQVVHNQSTVAAAWKTTFLSGNKPLVDVLRAALSAEFRRSDALSKTLADARAKTLIHSVHTYLEDLSRSDKPPIENIVVFDEAQRAWHAAKMAKRDRDNKEKSDIFSEPHQMLSLMDRHSSGAVLIALCGTGQEIHDGEAGINEWIAVHGESFPHWDLRFAPDQDVTPEQTSSPNFYPDSLLHLGLSVRSHRADRHAGWVDAVLTGNSSKASRLINQSEFPILVTRSLDTARTWLRQNTIANRRCGLLASSEAKRLRAYGIEISKEFRDGIDYGIWFAGDPADFRSSNQLEVAATEFDCQGLELDRVGLCWCWDAVLENGQFEPRVLHGANWRTIKDPQKKQYAINKYRVLLTRAREGMVIWVPSGSETDPTRTAAEMDDVYEFLRACGTTPLPA
jgi:hypothetical protein